MEEFKAKIKSFYHSSNFFLIFAQQKERDMLNGHGNDKYRYGTEIKIDFSSNIPGGINHSGLYSYLSTQLSTITDYPNPTAEPLSQLLASRLGIEPENLCITNGATESIYLAAQTFRDSQSAILVPTFSEYADACRIHGHKVKSIFSTQQIPSDAQLIWICNPNNPTGSVITREEMLQLVEKHGDKIFVIDQSYGCLSDTPLLRANEAVNYPNIILIHSLTKEFSVPGLRLGYITANSLLIKRLFLNRMPWSVNQLAILGGCYLLKHEDEYSLDLAQIFNERIRMERNLSSLGGMEVWPSHTNFLLVQLRLGKASYLKDYLAKNHQILIRDCRNFEGLDERFFRIAVQQPKENDALLSAIENWLQE